MAIPPLQKEAISLILAAERINRDRQLIGARRR
jgi:hypothetical protein